MPARKRNRLKSDAPLDQRLSLNSSKTDFKGDVPLQLSKKYSVTLLCNHSIRLPDVFFTNLVASAASNPVNDRIVKTMRLDRQEVKIEDLPFKEEGSLQIRTRNTISRITSILQNYLSDSFEEGDEEGIKKCSFPDKASGILGKEKGDLLRVFYRVSDDDTRLEIILIDPNHLFATEKFAEKYSSCKAYSTDIKRLLSDQKVFIRMM